MVEANKDSKGFKTRFDKAKTIREQWAPLLEDAYDLFLPNRAEFTRKTKGENRVGKLRDDTGAQSLQEFVTQLKNKLLPSQQRWSQLIPSGNVEVQIINGKFDEDAKKDLQVQLDRNTDILFNYIWDSNFDSAMVEALQDMSISTGALMIQETGDIDQPLNYVCVPSTELVIEESPSGDIKNVWREWDVKAEEINQLWPDKVEDRKLDETIRKTPTKKIRIIEGTVYNYETEKYDYKVYTESADCKIIFESAYKVSPWVVFRWGKAPSETWGRGPALNCISTMSTLNRLVSDLLKNNAMHISPPLLINSGGFVNPTKVKIAPNQRIITKSDWTGSSSPAQFLQNGSNFQLGMGMRTEYQQQVKEAFFLQFMGGADAPVRSATEISIRNQQMLEQQTSAFTRLKRELIDQVMKRSYYVLKRVGLVQELDVDGKLVAVKATSPLAQVQDMKDVEALQQYFGTVMGLGGEAGMMMASMSVDIEAVPDFLADKFKVPAALRMDEKKKKAQAQKLQQAVEQTGMGGMGQQPPAQQ